MGVCILAIMLPLPSSLALLPLCWSPIPGLRSHLLWAQLRSAEDKGLSPSPITDSLGPQCKCARWWCGLREGTRIPDKGEVLGLEGQSRVTLGTGAKAEEAQVAGLAVGLPPHTPPPPSSTFSLYCPPSSLPPSLLPRPHSDPVPAASQEWPTVP